MDQFVKNLQKEMNQKIEKIERSGENAIKKSLGASHILGESFDRLKAFVITYQFKEEPEEIEFFKEMKPKLFYRLIYYREVYNIEINRPIAGIETQRKYLLNEQEVINKYTEKRLDFIRYYRSGATHLDRLYFLRGKTDVEQYLEPCFHEFDPYFSTNCDFIVAKLLSNDLLSSYLLNEIELLDRNDKQYVGLPFTVPILTWQDSKAGLVELIYGLDTKGSFGDVSLAQLAGYISAVFNVQMDMNLSRTFGELRIRNNPTPWLDELKESLLKRMRLFKRNKKKGDDKRN